MCGFNLATLVYFAIAIVVILGFVALIRVLFYGSPPPGQPLLAFSFGGPYGGIINIVIGVAIAVFVLLFILRIAECVNAGRVGWQDDIQHLGLLHLLG